MRRLLAKSKALSSRSPLLRGSAKVSLERTEVLLGFFKVLMALSLDILLVVCSRLGSSLIGLHLALDGPTAWMAVEHGLDVDLVLWLGEVAEKCRDRLAFGVVLRFDCLKSGGRQGGGLTGRRLVHGSVEVAVRVVGSSRRFDVVDSGVCHCERSGVKYG